MSTSEKSIDNLIHELRERAKELACLYEVQELLGNPELSLDEICRGILEAIPPGWQYPDVCHVEIHLAEKSYTSPGLINSPWKQTADIFLQDERLGWIGVSYREERPASDEGPFLKEERKLINTIAEQFGFYLLHQQLREVFQAQMRSEEEPKSDWRVILDLLRRTDPNLLTRITRKMITYLSWNGIPGVKQLLELFNPPERAGELINGFNRPFQGQQNQDLLAISDEVFTIASKSLPQEDILDNIQKWIKEDRSSFLVDILVSPSSSLADIGSAFERYYSIAKQGIELTSPREKWFRMGLIRRFLSDRPEFIEVAKQYIDIEDFHDLIGRVIHSSDSHGTLGGKSSGLFLAERILKKSPGEERFIRDVKTPKTWYLSSDSVFTFMSYNNLEDIIEQKYKDLSQIRQEYPYILHVFKNSPLPPEIIKGLSLALDEFNEVPLIVRSSSYLEDRVNLAFAGKYKSLFIANQGTKKERLLALIDAITEVFASMFAPDPIEYRYRHSLIDYHEEMAILIQEVVGTKVGRYYFPAFAGVAFSRNDFPWSSRISREDGLIRVVPGLGTRAVDRLRGDYPLLIAPGQPKIRVNVSPEEILHYSPQFLDVINLDSRSFETVDFRSVVRECGRDYPMIQQLLSVVEHNRIRQSSAMTIDFNQDDLVMTFEGLFTRTPFLEQIGAILHTLEEAFDHPVDVEFAHDGEHFYLLQCRAQSHQDLSPPVNIPKGHDKDRIIFSADRFVTTARIADISHIVFVDPQKYSKVANFQDLAKIGQAVGALNQRLPKRHFILIGPGRWGSRGDIRLGVNVTYSDINNTAMLIEIARRQEDYLPEPSFGTHFFLDLVESSIRYLPLYPDDPDVFFNEEFFTTQRNILPDLCPEFADLAGILQVIDVASSTGGLLLQVYMDGEKEKAVAVLDKPCESFLS